MAIRLKFARSLSKISRPDDWKWNRWLKIPTNSTEEDFTFYPVKINGREKEQINILIPALELFLFFLPNSRVILPAEFNRWLTKKSTKDKTSLIPPQKTFRIFISKIQVEVTKNKVPEDPVPHILFTYEPAKPQIPSLDFFEDRITNLPELIEYEFRSTAEALTKEYNFDIPGSEPGIDLFNECDVPEVVLYCLPENDVRVGVNLIRWKSAEKTFCHTDQYQFGVLSVTENMLATADKMISRSISFDIDASSISKNILYEVPETIDVSLLKAEEFRTGSIRSFPIGINPAIDHNNYFAVYDSSFIHYVGKNKILISSSKVFPVNFHKLDASSTITIPYTLDHNEERLISFQELSSDFIIRSYDTGLFNINTEDIEVKDNPVLDPGHIEYFSSKEVFDGLYMYQKEAIDFLMNNSKTVLRYDPMLNYKPQVLFSLLLLLRQGKIRTTLIIKNTSDVISATINKEDDWAAALRLWAPEIPYESNLTNSASKPKSINFTSYESLNSLKLKKFDCIILDKYSDECHSADELIRSSECQRVCIITTSKNSDVPFSFNTLSFDRSQVNEELPVKKYEYRWLQLDKKQTLEYKSQLVQGQLKIYASIDRGEIYIIKPHLFTLLHQLLQTCNFASDEFSSRKTDALLNDIRSSSGKVIVLSQYEKYGLQRIEQVLHSAGIEFAAYRTGSAENERSLQEFRTNNKIKVLIADVKAINSHLNTGTISTLIHFDHWWNPVSQWQLEDRLINSNSVLVVQYCTENTIEEDIYKKLSQRELTDKLIFESLNPSVFSDIITDEEWLRLYDIRTEEDIPKPLLNIDLQKKMQSYTLDELVTMVQRFITRIGYAKQKALHHVSEGVLLSLSSRMIGKKEENVLVFINMNDETDQGSVKLFYDEYLKYKNISKAFFITPGRISQWSLSLFNYHSHKITYLDGSRLGRLMHLFNLI